MGFLVLSVLAVLGLVGVAAALPGGSPSEVGSAAVGRLDEPRVAAEPEAADGPDDRPAGAVSNGQEAQNNGSEAQKEEGASGTAGAGDEKGQEEPSEKGAGTEQQASSDEEPAIPRPATNDLWMTVPKMDLYDDYVANDESLAAMDAGAIKLPSTGFPWQEGANTYIAAHRIGYPGTESDYQFYDLPNLALGDRIYLGDANGTTYTYEVSGFKEVLPSETYVTAPKAGRDMISLQTCIEDYGDYWTMGPNWYVRYVVQADRVSVDPA